MKKSNFLKTFETLSPKEVRKFSSYLKCTHKNSKILITIFEFYEKYHLQQKSFPELNIAYQKIFKIPLKEPKNIVKLQNGLSDLNLILKDYLIQIKITDANFEKEFLWLQILEERKSPHQRDLLLKKLKKQIKETKVKSIWNPLQELQLYHFEFFKNDFKKNHASIALIHDGLHAMDDFYISLQLRYAAESLNRANLFSLPFTPTPLLSAIISLLKKEPSTFSIQNQLYYYVYLFLLDKNYKQFTLLKNFVLKNENSLHREERLTALIYMINYLAVELRNGNQNLLEEIFELYKWGLSNENIMVHNGIIEVLQFQNIINVSCRIKDFPWSKNFIETHQQFLEENFRKQSVSIAYGMIFFGEKKFHNVLENFENVKFNEVVFELQARIYILASHYELADTDDLDNQCESFIRFVKRNKNIGDSTKNAAINFARILQYLRRKKMFKKEIKKYIEDENELFFKPWLSEKLASYKRL